MKADAGQDSIVEVKGLEVMFPKAGRTVQAVRGIDLNVRRGEIVGIVGESGSGKSTVGAAIMQLLKPPAVWSGHVRFDNLLLEQLTSAQLRSLRGKRMALVPQAAMNALNPVLSIRTQMREAIRLHGRIPLAKADERIDELLLQVGLEAQWGSAFPHELSGGMKQRVVIATALLNEPELIIADEPTTGLDVMVQAEIVRLLVRLQRQYGMAMIFISHDLPVVMKLANRMLMMKDGQIVEQGETAALRTRPEHPYTRKLLAAIPRLAAEGRQDE